MYLPILHPLRVELRCKLQGKLQGLKTIDLATAGDRIRGFGGVVVRPLAFHL